jgi:hypothetical protein
MLFVLVHSAHQLMNAEPICMKLGMHIMTTEHISTAYFINTAYQSVCLYVYPTIVARQRLGKFYPSFLC